MPAKTTTRPRPAGRPLKSPLAVASSHIAPQAQTAAEPAQEPVQTERKATIAEFEDYLRTTTNRDDRPYEDGSINAYVSPAKHLDGWMTAKQLNGDFTTVDTTTLNRYFREYYRDHGQGGTTSVAPGHCNNFDVAGYRLKVDHWPGLGVFDDAVLSDSGCSITEVLERILRTSGTSKRSRAEFAAVMIAAQMSVVFTPMTEAKGATSKSPRGRSAIPPIMSYAATRPKADGGIFS